MARNVTLTLAKNRGHISRFMCSDIVWRQTVFTQKARSLHGVKIAKKKHGGV